MGLGLELDGMDERCYYGYNDCDYYATGYAKPHALDVFAAEIDSNCSTYWQDCWIDCFGNY